MALDQSVLLKALELLRSPRLVIVPLGGGDHLQH